MPTAFAALVSAATATPTPTPEVDPNLVTPGPGGFLAILFIAVAVILLLWDMMRRIRRGRVRADIAEQLDAEAAEAAAPPATDGEDPQQAQSGPKT